MRSIPEPLEGCQVQQGRGIFMAKDNKQETTTTDPVKFIGFSQPKSNYYKVPNEWVEILAFLDNVAEIKILNYLIRHTWGFQEYGIFKHLTVDEFMNGRKHKDGSRFDSGTGLSEMSVRNGIRRALEHGFIEVEIDDRDKGRIKKYYRLKMQQPDHELNEPDELERNQQQEEKEEMEEIGVQSLDPNPTKFRPRSEKDTLERNFISFERENPKNGKKAYSLTEHMTTRKPVESKVENTRESLEKPVAINQIVQDRLQQLQTIPSAPPQNGTQPPGTKLTGNWKKAPLFIQAMIADWFSLELNDQAKNSSITRTHRIYLIWKQKYPDATVEQLEDGFRDRMQQARTKTKYKTPRVKTKDGRFNRMPLFFACLEEVCGLKQLKQPD
jgi:hypothetical protein